MYNRRVDEKLKEELKVLQNKFNAGHELTVKHLPGEIRYSQNGNALSGEINGYLILIYEDKEARAISTLYHEFVEYLWSPLVKDYLDIINHQNKLLTQLLYKRKEDIIEKFTKSFKKS